MAVTAPGYPLSYNQSAYLVLEWLAQLRSHKRTQMSMAMALELDGALNVEALEEALHEIVARHEVLRSAFPDPRRLTAAQQAAILRSLQQNDLSAGGLFTQTPLEPSAVRLSIARVPAPQAAGIEGLHAEIAQEMARPFDYSRPPLMHATLFTLHQAKHVLVVVLHHLVTDKWSIGVLQKELARLYDCRVSGRSFADVPALPLQYGEFARKERATFGSGLSDDVVSYWKNAWRTYGNAQLKAGDLGLTTISRGAGADPGFQALTLDPSVMRSLRNAAKRSGATVYMVCLAALAVLVHAYTQRTVSAWWGYVSNRKTIDLEGLIGWISHGHLVGVSMQPTDSVLTLMKRVRDAVCEMYRRQDMPVQVLWHLLRDCNVASFDEDVVSFDFVLARSGALTLADGVTVTPAPRRLLSTGTFRAVGLWAIETNADLTVECRYPTDRCSGARAAALLEDYAAVLSGIASAPERDVSSILPLAAVHQRA